MDFPIFIYIALLLLAALLSSRVMKVLKLPNVTGYIVTGIIMGPFVFGLLFNSFENAKNGVIYNYIKSLGWVSTIALGFIAFSIGTSFKASTLKMVGKRVIIITILEAFGASLLVFVALFVAHLIAPQHISIELVLTLSAIASATAPAATLMIIKQYKAKGELVSTLLPVVALDDAAALILFAILFQIALTISKGGSFNIYSMVFKPLIEIAISLGFGTVIGLFISFLNRFFKSRNNKLVLCILSVFLAAGLNVLFKMEQLGGFELSSLLMCMMTGAIYANMCKDSDRTLDVFERFTSPIYMMFFVLSGASLDLSVFTSKDGYIILIISLIYIVSRIIGKYTGAFTGASISHCSDTVRKYIGLTLIPQAGVAIGLATTAGLLFSQHEETMEAGALIVAIILASTLIYEIIGPLISKYALSKANEISEE